MIGNLSLTVPVWYLAISVIAFLVYGFDKARAVAKGRRVPEQTLHLLALAGGWPGALAAQHLMRHKVRKGSFIAVFWLTVVLNCILLFVLFTSSGRIS